MRSTRTANSSLFAASGSASADQPSRYGADDRGQAPEQLVTAKATSSVTWQRSTACLSSRSPE